MRDGDTDDIEAVLRHERRVGRVDGFPSFESDRSGKQDDRWWEKAVDVPVGGEGTREDGTARGVCGVDVGASLEGVMDGRSVAFGGSLEESEIFKRAVWATHCRSSADS